MRNMVRTLLSVHSAFNAPTFDQGLLNIEAMGLGSVSCYSAVKT